MELLIYTNEDWEEKALVDLETGTVIVKGDHYHDKIGDKIQGYLQALKDHNIYNEKVNEEEITPSHEMFEKVGFYSEDKG